MAGLVWIMLLALLVIGIVAALTESEDFIGLQFFAMLGMVVVIPIASLIL